jgi:flagellar motor switch protein FliG
LNALQKVAAFLFIIGLEKAGKIMALMDSDEIKKVLNEFNKLSALSPAVQESVFREFTELGYNPAMNPVETLWVLRQMFGGSKISDMAKRRFSFL